MEKNPCKHMLDLQGYLRDECLWVYCEHSTETKGKVFCSCKECAVTVEINLCQIYAGKKKLKHL